MVYYAKLFNPLIPDYQFSVFPESACLNVASSGIVSFLLRRLAVRRPRAKILRYFHHNRFNYILQVSFCYTSDIWIKWIQRDILSNYDRCNIKCFLFTQKYINTTWSYHVLIRFNFIMIWKHVKTLYVTIERFYDFMNFMNNSTAKINRKLLAKCKLFLGVPYMKVNAKIKEM